MFWLKCLDSVLVKRLDDVFVSALVVHLHVKLRSVLVGCFGPFFCHKGVYQSQNKCGALNGYGKHAHKIFFFYLFIRNIMTTYIHIQYHKT